ncbi:MAG: hypothetical protein Q7R71_00290 [bacterium]|nr:hypothetical protein [bacterium]
MNPERVANFILRAGVAFAFLYPPINALFDPSTWIGYLPHFARGIGGLSDIVLLHAFGAVEVLIALWILSGKKIFWPSLVATAILVAIIFLNLQDFQIIFRDVSIAAAALALAVMNYRSKIKGATD